MFIFYVISVNMLFMILISYRRLHTEAQVRPTVSVPAAAVIC